VYTVQYKNTVIKLELVTFIISFNITCRIIMCKNHLTSGGLIWKNSDNGFDRMSYFIVSPSPAGM
jgi:hypothetical protein